MEKRIYPRKLINSRVVFEDEFGEGLICLNASDISLGGLFITSDIPIKEGSYVLLSFNLPGSAVTIRATGQVVRIVRAASERGLGKREGFGVRFVGLSEDAVAAIEDYVS